VQDQVLHAWSLTVQGQAAQAAGDHHRAAALFDRALPAARKGGNRSVVALSLTGAAASAAVLGDMVRGPAWVDEAVATWRTIGSTWGLALALLVSARLAWGGRDVGTAGRWCRESLSLVRQLGDRHGLARGLELLAAVETASDPAAAARSLGTAARLRDRLPAPAPPDVRADLDRLAADLRNRLGAEAFDREWAAGTGDERGQSSPAPRH
ncbi:MAG TPA: hypothetical protein VK911_00310, partial [Vicinamibacterales bacterium]|nr:hypothetical protein [Vicinamibacterales bacterium]